MEEKEESNALYGNIMHIQQNMLRIKARSFREEEEMLLKT